MVAPRKPQGGARGKSASQQPKTAKAPPSDGGGLVPIDVQIRLPNGKIVPSTVSPKETVGDLRLATIEAELDYTCSFLWHSKAGRPHENLELRTVLGTTSSATFELREASYDEKETRLHVAKLKDFLSTASPRLASTISPGLSVFDEIDVNGSESADVSTPNTETIIESVTFPAAIASFYPNQTTKHLEGSENEDLSPGITGTISCPSPKKNAEAEVCIRIDEKPLPFTKKMQGQILTIQAQVGVERYCIEATVRGFAVCPTGNDAPSSGAVEREYVHSLSKLLCSVSSAFRTHFYARVEASKQTRVSQVPICMTLPGWNWLVPATENPETDLDADPVIEEGIKEWNEDIQYLRENNKWKDIVQKSDGVEQTAQMNAAMFHDRQHALINAQFLQAAVEGAVKVLEGAVVALNPSDPVREQLFVWNQILFSFPGDWANMGPEEASNSREESEESFEGARLISAKDLASLRKLEDVDEDKPSTSASVIVDWKGRRVICQTIVPGILRFPSAAMVVYGVMEQNLPGQPDPKELRKTERYIEKRRKFCDILTSVSKALHLETHKVYDKTSGEIIEIATASETKGVLGSDERLYLLDLSRTTPTDVDFLHASDLHSKSDISLPPYPHQFLVFRHELVDLFVQTKLQEKLREEVARADAGGSPISVDLSGVHREWVFNVDAFTKVYDDVPQVEDNLDSEVGEVKEKPLAASQEGSSPSGMCSGDKEGAEGSPPESRPQNRAGFTSADWEELRKQEERVRSLGKWLRSHVLPSLVKRMRNGENMPLTGASLTDFLHREGVNMRYLGYLKQLIGDEIESIRPVSTGTDNSNGDLSSIQKGSCPPPAELSPVDTNNPSHQRKGMTSDKDRKAMERMEIKRLEVFAMVCEQEMLTRAWKHIFTYILNDTMPTHVLSTITATLNKLLQTPVAQKSSEQWNPPRRYFRPIEMRQCTEIHKRGKYESQKTQRNAHHLLDSRGSWDICMWALHEVRRRFRYDMSFEDYAKFHALRSRYLLREVCLKTGIQLYFPVVLKYLRTPADQEVQLPGNAVVGIAPLVKHVLAKPHFPSRQLEAGQHALSQGNIDVALPVLEDALFFHEHAYFQLHPRTIEMYSYLAELYYQLAGGPNASSVARKAIKLAENSAKQQKASDSEYLRRASDLSKMVVVGYERLYGIDSHQACHAYIQASLYEFSRGDLKAGMTYLNRGIQIWAMVTTTSSHPDFPQQLTSLGHLHLKSSSPENAIPFFVAAAASYEQVIGEGSPITAGAYHHLATAYFFAGQARKALACEKKAYNAWKLVLGKSDQRLLESERCLSVFTNSAVQESRNRKMRAHGEDHGVRQSAKAK